MSELDGLKERIEALESGAVRDGQKSISDAIESQGYLKKDDFEKRWKAVKEADDAEEKSKFYALEAGIKQLELAYGKWESNGFAAAANGANMGLNGLGIGWDMIKFEPKSLIDITEMIKIRGRSINDMMDLLQQRMSTLPGVGGLFSGAGSEEPDLTAIRTHLSQLDTKVAAAAKEADLQLVKTKATDAAESAQGAHREIDKINQRLARVRDARDTASSPASRSSSDTSQADESARALRNLQTQINALVDVL
jgi:hypothetical protein